MDKDVYAAGVSAFQFSRPDWTYVILNCIFLSSSNANPDFLCRYTVGTSSKSGFNADQSSHIITSNPNDYYKDFDIIYAMPSADGLEVCVMFTNLRDALSRHIVPLVRRTVTERRIDRPRIARALKATRHQLSKYAGFQSLPAITSHLFRVNTRVRSWIMKNRAFV